MQMTKSEIVAKVESWDWNLSIFEIYDEVKEMPSWDKQEVLNHAYNFFNGDKMIKELATFFNIDLDAQIWDKTIMSKQNREHMKASKHGKKYSHTGAKPLVESLTNKGCMVTQKIRKAQEAKRPWLIT